MTHETHARIAALVAAGFLLTSGGAAFADTATSGNGSIGGGNQIGADVDAPVNVCGNAVAVLGVAGAQCEDSGAESGDAPEEEDEEHTPEKPEDDGEDPGEDPGEGENPDPGEEPEEPADPPVDDPGDNGEDPDEPEEPSVPGVPGEPEAPADESRVGGGGDTDDTSPVGFQLADTGMERGPLVALVVGGAAAVVAGVGLILGLRRRAKA